MKKKGSSSSKETSTSKAETKRKLLEALTRLEEEDVASNHFETDNGDMIIPRGIAQAYAEAYLLG